MRSVRGYLVLPAGAAVAVALALAPAAAGAAKLDTDPAKPCYGTGDRVSLVGTGFKPSKPVVIRRDGKRIGRVRSDAAGAIAALATVPSISKATQTSTYVATHGGNPPVVARTRVTLSSLKVTISPGDTQAQRPRQIRARGFTTGDVLYAHVVRGTSRRTVRIGDLIGACRRFEGVRRLFGTRARPGFYKVQFDTFRTYRSDRPQRVRYEVQIRRRSRTRASASNVELRITRGEVRR